MSGSTQMIVNGGFEGSTSGSVPFGWTYTNPGCTNSGVGKVKNDNSKSHSGCCCWQDDCQSVRDFLRQTIVTVPGQVYIISYYIYNDDNSVPNSATITIT
ncbi:unnamed protein product [Didymodactylos carnosus]|uniref:Uncharacterized protein n=1 Tax=Didymodactylos carnosus TaxID=1234261 RepID=A0A816E579_9BILA|nr:unnamed protein product [Didymodactylos carnosus]CAF4555804.1 unnamed protein product [Didymodactylos carnosus]